MTALHELYLSVKQQVADAIAAVNAATIAAAEFTEQTIADALAAVHVLDDYLDYFGLVGSPIDAAVDLLVDQLMNLANALDDQNYYAIYQKTFNAANQFQSAKSDYDGLTQRIFSGGGAGTTGGWQSKHQQALYTCWNRNGTDISPIQFNYKKDPQPQPVIDVDLTILLGPCSGLLPAKDFGYGSGYFQYVARACQTHFRRARGFLMQYVEGGIIKQDNGDEPFMPELPQSYWWDKWTDPIGFMIYTEEVEDYQEFRYEYNITDWSLENRNPAGHPWPFIGSQNGWPYGYPYQAIPIYVDNPRTANQHVMYLRDRLWSVIGRSSEGYWEYEFSYWIAERILYNSEIDNNVALPDLLKFIAECTPPEKKGKDVPFLPVLPFLDDNLRKQLTNRLALNLIWLPYELCFDGQKLLWEGEQMTFGDV